MTDTQNRANIDQDWRSAGDAWGHSSIDWACLFEHYATEATSSIFELTNVGEGTDLLDIACGSGLAIRRAAAAGAITSGLDASASLLQIAKNRNPQSDIRVGSMFELPWADDSFDVAVSINGIWGGCEEALVEARRVLRPTGILGFSFWGRNSPRDLRGCFLAFAKHAPKQHLGSMKQLNNIATPGVAEQMLETAGFEVLERGATVSTIEWADEQTAWRALSSLGPAVPALENGNPELVRRDVLEAIENCKDSLGMYRFRNDHQFVIARPI